MNNPVEFIRNYIAIINELREADEDVHIQQPICTNDDAGAELNKG